MNSNQREILAILESGPRPASALHGALRLRGFKGAIEAVYGELASLEAGDFVCIEGAYDGHGRLLSNVWALGRTPASPLPPSTSVADILHQFGRASTDDEHPRAGVSIHRCL